MRRLQTVAASVAARLGVGLAIAATLLLASCHNFFVCEGKASCPSSGSGTGSTTDDFAYVSNSSSGSTYISGYDLTNGSLTALTGSPYNLDFVPVAMSISPNNAFLYIATLPGASNPGIYLYSIASTGEPSIENSGDVYISTTVSSMDISPDGNYLFVLSSAGDLLSEYQANSSTGALSFVTSLSLPGTTCALAGSPISQTCTVKVSPTGEFVAVSLGTAGTAIFPYTSSSGITSSSGTLVSSGNSTIGDYSVAFDDSNNAYIARTSALDIYAVNSSTISLTSNNAYGSSTATPRSVVLSTDYDQVYTANEASSNISGYSIGSGGALTAISGSPFTGPTNVSALGVDSSGGYMVAAGYNSSSGVQLFSISSSGALTLVTSAASGTSTAYPVVLAMSH